MGKGNRRDPEVILTDIRQMIEDHGGVVLQDLVIKYLSEHYANSYAGMTLIKKVTRDLKQRNIAKLVCFKIPSNIQTSHSKHSPKTVQIYVSCSLSQDEIRSKAAQAIRESNILIEQEQPQVSHSLSRELIFESAKKKRKSKPLNFPPLKDRAMLLHLFLLHTFPNDTLDPTFLINYMPYSLSLQIFLESPNIIPPDLSIIPQYPSSSRFDLDILLSFLKPPYQPLILNNKIQKVSKLSIPQLNFSRYFCFLDDPDDYSDYWSTYFAIHNNPSKYPIDIASRFQQYIIPSLSKLGISDIPFFPRDVESFSKKLGIACPAVSYTIKQVSKQRQAALKITPSKMLISKIFPSSGIASLLITQHSALPHPPIPHLTMLQCNEEVEEDLNGLARLFARTKVTSDLFLTEKTTNWLTVKKDVKKWIDRSDVKIFNMGVSFREDPVFCQLMTDQTADTILSYFSNHIPDSEMRVSEVIKMRTFSNHIRHFLSPSVFSAIEFLKVVLKRSNESDDTFDTRLRQICHYEDRDLLAGMYVLDGIGILRYQDWNKSYSLQLPKQFIDIDKGKISPFDFFSFENNPDNWEFSFDSPDLLGAYEGISNSLVLPQLEKLQITTSLPQYSPADPITEFAFGEYEIEPNAYDDFVTRLVMMKIRAAGVDGASLSELIHLFDDESRAQEIIDKLAVLEQAGEIVKVPGAFDPRWSAYVPLQVLCRAHNKQAMLLPVHIWLSCDGTIDVERLSVIRNNLAMFVLTEGSVDFMKLLDKFAYVSPYDLCLLLDSMEADGAIFSRYYSVKEATVDEQELVTLIPTPPSIELFLHFASLEHENGTYFQRIVIPTEECIQSI